MRRWRPPRSCPRSRRSTGARASTPPAWRATAGCGRCARSRTSCRSPASRRCSWLLNPLALPVALVCLAHSWVIPELYAQRGANVLRPRGAGARAAARRTAAPGPSGARSACSATSSGTTPATCTRARASSSSPVASAPWIVGEAGAVLLHGRRRRAYCYCVKVDPRLRGGERAALGRPDRPPAARPAQRRGRLCHRRQPRVLRRALAAAPAHARRDATRARCSALRLPTARRAPPA